MSSESRQFEDVVGKLEQQRQSLEKQVENANRLTAKANTEKQRAENEARRAREDAEREIELAKQEAQRIVSRTRAQADALIEELEKARREKEMTAEQRTKLVFAVRVRIDDSSGTLKAGMPVDVALS